MPTQSEATAESVVKRQGVGPYQAGVLLANHGVDAQDHPEAVRFVQSASAVLLNLLAQGHRLEEARMIIEGAAACSGFDPEAAEGIAAAVRDVSKAQFMDFLVKRETLRSGRTIPHAPTIQEPERRAASTRRTSASCRRVRARAGLGVRTSQGSRRTKSANGSSSSGSDSDQPGEPSPPAEQPQLPGRQHHRGKLNVRRRRRVEPLMGVAA